MRYWELRTTRSSELESTGWSEWLGFNSNWDTEQEVALLSWEISLAQVTVHLASQYSLKRAPGDAHGYLSTLAIVESDKGAAR